MTVADFAAQALLIAAIHSVFPHDRIIGEEDSDKLQNRPDLSAQVVELVQSARLDDEESEALLWGEGPSGVRGGLDEVLGLIDLGARDKREERDGREKRKGRFWTMDPIDGTSAFLYGGQYAISLALVDEDGTELLGVLACPNLAMPSKGDIREGLVRIEERVLDREGNGLMLAAVRRHGATVRPIGTGKLLEAQRIDRRDLGSEPVDLRDLHLVDSSNSPATLSSKVRELAKITRAEYPGTEIYSSHMRYAAMALGGREFVQVRVPNVPIAKWSIWDHAGSQLIYTESGAGKVTDLAGNPIDFTTGRTLSKSLGLITADESIHGKILELVTKMQQGSR